MSYFETTHVVHGSQQSLRQFLGALLQPWRWAIMLANGGIRAERGGQPIPTLGLDTVLNSGDLVGIDDAYGVTYIELRKKASQDFRDFVFCPQRGKDPFLNNQVNALLADKTSIDVSLKVAYLKDLVAQLTPLGTFPIRHLLFVAHANPFGEIAIPIRKMKDEKDFSSELSWDGLKEAIDDGSLRADKAPNATLLPRPEDRNGTRVPCAIIIRGCSSGIHTILLAKIQEAFGNMIDAVIMPKFFDGADFIGKVSATVYAAAIEYFMHRFIVTSKTPLDRQGIIDAFKAAKLKDWLDNPVADSDWEDFVPKNVKAQAATKELTLKIDGRQQPGQFKVRFDPSPLEPSTQVMEQESEPTTKEIKDFLNKSWRALPAFQDTEWPFWKRMGLEDIDEFESYWTYEVNPDIPKQKGKWHVRGIRYAYEVRTPLVEKDGTMICHYRPKGEKGTESNNIDYNDDRIFGRFNHIPKHFAQRV